MCACDILYCSLSLDKSLKYQERAKFVVQRECAQLNSAHSYLERGQDIVWAYLQRFLSQTYCIFRTKFATEIEGFKIPPGWVWVVIKSYQMLFIVNLTFSALITITKSPISVLWRVWMLACFSAKYMLTTAEERPSTRDCIQQRTITFCQRWFSHECSFCSMILYLYECRFFFFCLQGGSSPQVIWRFGALQMG